MTTPNGGPEGANNNPFGQQPAQPHGEANGAQGFPTYPNGPEENPFGGSSQPYGQGAYGYEQNQGYQQYNQPQTALQPGKFDAIDSLGQAWKIFMEKPGAWILSSLVYIVIFSVVFFGSYVPMIFSIINSTDPVTGEVKDVNPTSMVLSGIGILIATIAIMLFQIVCLREAMYAVAGKRPEFRDFFTYKRFGMIFLVSIVVSVLVFLGLIALVIGSLVVGFFLTFATVAAVEEDATVGSSIKNSVNVVKANAVQTLILLLVLIAISAIGGSILIGYVVVYPIVYLSYAHAYRTAQGLPVVRRS
ncbi:hypothetical protein QVA66_11300 [Staphylococcus chromogenes]|nr:hypothetical protein [Staphylococcus chromogenes]